MEGVTKDELEYVAKNKKFKDSNWWSEKSKELIKSMFRAEKCDNISVQVEKMWQYEFRRDSKWWSEKI